MTPRAPRSTKRIPAPTTIDSYLATLSPEERAALEKTRKTIRAAAPGAEECISYQLPAFKLDGKLLVAFGAAAKHCSLYPGSATTVAIFARELAGYDTSKGTIRFPADRPPPAALVRKIVRARIAENAAAAAKRTGSASAVARRSELPDR